MHVFRWSNSSAGRGPGEAGLEGGAGAGLEVHTISVFSVMAEPTSAWAWGGHMDPPGWNASLWKGVELLGKKPRDTFAHLFNLSFSILRAPWGEKGIMGFGNQR